MITDEVIKEIYKKYKRDRKSDEAIEVEPYIELLKPYHRLKVEDDELIVEDLEEFNPFRRFLMRRLRGIIEFDRNIAFVFSNHILFFEKESSDMHVHFKPEEKRGFFSRLFHPGDDED